MIAGREEDSPHEHARAPAAAEISLKRAPLPERSAEAEPFGFAHSVPVAFREGRFRDAEARSRRAQARRGTSAACLGALGDSASDTLRLRPIAFGD